MVFIGVNKKYDNYHEMKGQRDENSDAQYPSWWFFRNTNR